MRLPEPAGRLHCSCERFTVGDCIVYGLADSICEGFVIDETRELDRAPATILVTVPARLRTVPKLVGINLITNFFRRAIVGLSRFHGGKQLGKYLVQPGRRIVKIFLQRCEIPGFMSTLGEKADDPLYTGY